MQSITEKDLYLYIFYPDQLDEEKSKFIDQNINLFSSEIELLNEIKKNINSRVDPTIIDKINEKISAPLPTVIELKKDNAIIQSNPFVLAADSPKSKFIQNTDTFKDSNNLYLAKVINSAIDNKIYIFQNSDDEPLEIKITILPSDDTFHTNLGDQPIIISPPQIIEKIILQINP